MGKTKEETNTEGKGLWFRRAILIAAIGAVFSCFATKMADEVWPKRTSEVQVASKSDDAAPVVAASSADSNSEELGHAYKVTGSKTVVRPETPKWMTVNWRRVVSVSDPGSPPTPKDWKWSELVVRPNKDHSLRMDVQNCDGGPAYIKFSEDTLNIEATDPSPRKFWFYCAEADWVANGAHGDVVPLDFNFAKFTVRVDDRVILTWCARVDDWKTDDFDVVPKQTRFKYPKDFALKTPASDL